MRVSDAFIFQQQSLLLDNDESRLQQLAFEASSGKSLNEPSDSPTTVAADLSIHTQIAVTTQVNSNLTNLTNNLNAVDGALSSVTNILQSVRGLAIQAAGPSLSPSQLSAIGTQVDQQLQEVIGLANTQFGGTFLFGGTAKLSTAAVQSTGAPIASVTALGNNVHQTQVLANGQTIPSNVTLQQAFNVGASNGSPSVFQTLINLRDTLQSGTVVDQSASQVNVNGTAIAPATTVAQLSAGAAPQLLATPLTPDASGNVSISIASGTAPNGVTVTFTPAATVAGIVAQINAVTAQTGVTAAFNAQTQRLSLTSANGAAFTVTDVPSAGSATASNFTTAFSLQTQADLTHTISTQLGDIDHVLNTVLDARSQVGATIQTVQSSSNTASATLNSDTQVQSSLEDADVAQTTTQLSLAQTVLQAAEATTSQLLQNGTLFKFLQ